MNECGHPAHFGVEDRPQAWHGFGQSTQKGARMAKTHETREFLHLLYQRRGSKLWGIILFFKVDQASGDKLRPHRKSRPFVIADYTRGIERPIVFGSLAYLLAEIKRLINQFTAVNERWSRERNQQSLHPQTGHLDLEYDRQVMDFAILLATYGRNLIEVVRRLDTRTMPKLNQDNEPDGDIRLRELFDTLIHNRYFYFDGACIRDIFTADPPARRSLANQFMGYGFDLDLFGRTIWEIVHEIQFKDLTQLIRQHFKQLSMNSRPQDIVFLIQNVESMSHLLKSKFWSKEYSFLRNALFASAGLDRSQSQMKFQPPTVRIVPDLSRKQFDVHFRYGPAAADAIPEETTIRRHHFEIGYVDFLDQLNGAFGEQRLLKDFERAPQPARRPSPASG